MGLRDTATKFQIPFYTIKSGFRVACQSHLFEELIKLNYDITGLSKTRALIHIIQMG